MVHHPYKRKMESQLLLLALTLHMVTSVGGISDSCSIYKTLEERGKLAKLAKHIQIENATSKALRSSKENLYVIESLF